MTHPLEHARDFVAEYDSRPWLDKQISPHSDLSHVIGLLRSPIAEVEQLRKERDRLQEKYTHVLQRCADKDTEILNLKDLIEKMKEGK